MTSDDVTYIDYDPHRVHLPTNAPHVHVRGTDQCLRSPGEPCLSGEALRARVRELEAEVERLTRQSEGRLLALNSALECADSSERRLQESNRVAFGRTLAANQRASDAEAERDEVLATARTNAAWVQVQHDLAVKARAERDALQQQVANVQDAIDEALMEQAGLLGPVVSVAALRAALDGPAAPHPIPEDCSTCGGSGTVAWEPFAQRDSDDDEQPCPDCPDGRTRAQAVGRRGGRWPERAARQQDEEAQG